MSRWLSYNKEDKFIYCYIRDQKLAVTPFVVEFGVSNGVTGSNTRSFLDLGWKGIWIEPSRVSFKRLQSWSRYLDVEIYNIAISNKTESQKFYWRPWHAGGSSLRHQELGSDDPHHSEVQCYQVSCRRISDVLCGREVGIMSIDTEGHDTIIITDMLTTDVRPQFLICENGRPEGRTSQKKLLEAEGYKFLQAMAWNQIFVHKSVPKGVTKGITP